MKPKPSEVAELQALVAQQEAHLVYLQSAVDRRYGPFYNVGGHLISRQRREQLLTRLSDLQQGTAAIANRLAAMQRRTRGRW